MRHNFKAQFVQLLKHWLCDCFVENWAHSVDQYWWQGLQFSMHLIDLLSILLRCNGVTGIQKAAVDQMGSRPPNSAYDLLLVRFWLWDMLWSFSVPPLS